MPELTTGLIENTPVGGVRPSVTFTIKITNDDTVASTVQIEGFYVVGTTKILYVLEFFVLDPGEVATRIYYAEFDEFEFQFFTSSDAVEISAWGKDAAGNLTTAHRLVAAELDPIGLTGITGATGATGDTGATGATGATGEGVDRFATVTTRTKVTTGKTLANVPTSE
ncbi:hypothetical protein [Candidatus Desulfosporosinus nitrosoreducens]|uniref:hypothetical protein n=1 Tax=Candidatus Desulfosporosinus nitrosoreducens TaxID=3401928 RepID=UPI0035AC1225